jgi:hypothetical protein
VRVQKGVSRDPLPRSRGLKPASKTGSTKIFPSRPPSPIKGDYRQKSPMESLPLGFFNQLFFHSQIFPHRSTEAEVTQIPPRQIRFTEPRKVQHEFKHAADFGIHGNWNTSNRSAFQTALTRHVQNPNVREIRGTYRGIHPVIHYVEPHTRLWVATDLHGHFVAAWKLSAIQYHHLIQHHNIQ